MPTPKTERGDVLRERRLGEERARLAELRGRKETAKELSARFDAFLSGMADLAASGNVNAIPDVGRKGKALIAGALLDQKTLASTAWWIYDRWKRAQTPGL